MNVVGTEVNANFTFAMVGGGEGGLYCLFLPINKRLLESMLVQWNVRKMNAFYYQKAK